MQKVATRQPCCAVSLRCNAAQRDGAARPELCTLSSAQPLVVCVCMKCSAEMEFVNIITQERGITLTKVTVVDVE